MWPAVVRCSASGPCSTDESVAFCRRCSRRTLDAPMGFVPSQGLVTRVAVAVRRCLAGVETPSWRRRFEPRAPFPTRSDLARQAGTGNAPRTLAWLPSFGHRVRAPGSVDPTRRYRSRRSCRLASAPEGAPPGRPDRHVQQPDRNTWAPWPVPPVSVRRPPGGDVGHDAGERDFCDRAASPRRSGRGRKPDRSAHHRGGCRLAGFVALVATDFGSRRGGRVPKAEASGACCPAGDHRTSGAGALWSSVARGFPPKRDASQASALFRRPASPASRPHRQVTSRRGRLGRGHPDESGGLGPGRPWGDESPRGGRYRSFAFPARSR